MDSPPVPLPLVKSPPWAICFITNRRRQRRAWKVGGDTYEASDHAVEDRVLEVEGLARLANALLASAAPRG